MERRCLYQMSHNLRAKSVIAVSDICAQTAGMDIIEIWRQKCFMSIYTPTLPHTASCRFSVEKRKRSGARISRVHEADNGGWVMARAQTVDLFRTLAINS